MPVLGTKLHPPRPRRRLVQRDRLTDRLRAADGPRLILVAAPAGFGKTTLLAQWLAAAERRAAWLALDAGDADLGRFLTHLVAAIQTVEPDVGAEALALLETSPDAALVSLINEDAARAWARERGVAPDDPPAYLAEYDQLTLARLLLAEGDTRAALRLLDRVVEAARTDGSLIESRLVRALAHHANGDAEAAADLAAALAAGVPAGYLPALPGRGSADGAAARAGHGRRAGARPAPAGRGTAAAGARPTHRRRGTQQA